MNRSFLFVVLLLFSDRAALAHGHCNLGRSNVLLAPIREFDQAIPFEQIHPDDFIPALDVAISEANFRLAKWKKYELTGDLQTDFQTVVVGLQSINERVDALANIFSTFESQALSPELKAVSEQVNLLLTRHSVQFEMDLEIARRLEAFKSDPRVSAGYLSIQQTKLLEVSANDVAKLTEEKKQKYRAISEKLAVLSSRFRKTLVEDRANNSVWFNSEEQLDGVPERILVQARKLAADAGQSQRLLINLDQSIYSTVLTYAQSSASRHLLWSAAQNVGSRNSDIILETVQLRQELAELLGYSHYAQMKLVQDSRMAQSAEKVMAFLNQLGLALKPQAEKEEAELTTYVKLKFGVEEIQPWDRLFYQHAFLSEKFKVDIEELRKFFKVPQMLSGVFSTIKNLYQVEFREVTTVQKIHPLVQTYEIRDSRTQAYLGLLYLDLYAREGKSQGAWMSDFRTQGFHEGRLRTPHVNISLNLQPPTEGKPSGLSLSELKTLYHEFGHALHGLLSVGDHPILNGTNVAWDFVELPSQLFEKWASDPLMHQVFTRNLEEHSLSEALLQEAIARQNDGSAGRNLRNVQLAMLDMAFHTNQLKNESDLLNFEKRLESYRVNPQINAFSPVFSHIFAGGYAAGYYSYLWADVLAADAGALFESHGMFDPQLAQSFRSQILSKGRQAPPDVLFRNFAGRALDSKAFLNRMGVK